MTALRPHYLTTPRGQIRTWQAGRGPNLVALAGLTRAASVTARMLAELCPDWRITVVELPGIGGSARVASAALEDVADAAASALDWLGAEPYLLVAFELAAPVAALLAQDRPNRPLATLVVGSEDAVAWARRGIRPDNCAPRSDGTHLTSLWSFIRDRHLLDPADPAQPALAGEPLPDLDTLSETFVAAVVRPEGFESLWSQCCEGILRMPFEGIGRIARSTDLPEAIAAFRLPTAIAPLPETMPLPNRRLWHQYVDTERGRMHLRRAGSGGRPVLVIPTGGGSSAQFAPVVTGLAEDRQVVAVDYFGNGLSDKLQRRVTIEALAEDMLALLDALGLEETDVWGSHTGALVALEMALVRPERIGRIVMEGPVFISRDFRDDLLANYFPAIRPDKWGLHLPLVWNWRRDLFMFWPWYRVERSAARQLGLPPPQELHLYAVGILESGSTYDGAYRSAFAYDTRTRLPLLSRPAMICAGPDDMLKDGLPEAERLAPKDQVTVRETPTTVWWPDPDPEAAAETMATYREFLSQPSAG